MSFNSVKIMNILKKILDDIFCVYRLSSLVIAVGI